MEERAPLRQGDRGLDTEADRGAAEGGEAAGRQGARVMPRVLRYDSAAGLPEGAVYIGRAMPRYQLAGSRWGNQFRVGPDGTLSEVLAKHRAELLARPDLMAALPELRGRDLVCWCSPRPCHGDALLELANRD
jgi:hypothetical protein